MKNTMMYKLLFGLLLISQWGHTETCLNKKMDEVQIRAFIKEIIVDIEKSKVDLLSQKFQYPLDMFEFRFKNKDEFVLQWTKDNRLKGYMELKVYDENDKYTGTTTPKESSTMQIHYTEWKTVQFAITPGMIFDVKKIANGYKIVRWSSVD